MSNFLQQLRGRNKPNGLLTDLEYAILSYQYKHPNKRGCIFSALGIVKPSSSRIDALNKAWLGLVRIQERRVIIDNQIKRTTVVLWDHKK